MPPVTRSTSRSPATSNATVSSGRAVAQLVAEVEVGVDLARHGLLEREVPGAVDDQLVDLLAVGVVQRADLQLQEPQPDVDHGHRARGSSSVSVRVADGSSGSPRAGVSTPNCQRIRFFCAEARYG